MAFGSGLRKRWWRFNAAFADVVDLPLKQVDAAVEIVDNIDQVMELLPFFQNRFLLVSDASQVDRCRFIGRYGFSFELFIHLP